MAPNERKVLRVPAEASELLRAAATLLHDFNVEYHEPTPSPAELHERLHGLVKAAHFELLLVTDGEGGLPVGVAALKLQPSLWSDAKEAYLAELYVVPERRGQGFGRALITEAQAAARDAGADYIFLVTSEADVLARKLYQAAGFRQTEGEGGPRLVAYERELES